MRGQYSDSPLVVAVDSASPITSVAVGVITPTGSGGEAGAVAIVGARDTPGGRSSTHLLALLDEILAEHLLSIRRVERLIAARGPGSFTGLRVALATVLGLAQSLGAEATTVTTFEALARQASDRDRQSDTAIVAVVDALRGEWYAQTFAPGSFRPASSGEPAIIRPEQLLERSRCRIVGFGLDRLPAEIRERPGVELCDAAPLAPVLLSMAGAAGLEWNVDSLTRPLYLRPPAAKPRPETA